MNLGALAVKGIFWSVLQKWGGLFFHSASLLLLTHLLEPKAFGLVALANVIIAFIRVFIEQGFAQAIVQAKTVASIDLNTAFWSSLAMSLILSSAVFISDGYIASAFQEPTLAPVLRSLSPVFVLIALNSVQTALLQRQLKFKALAIRSLIALSTAGTIAIVMALCGLGVWSLVAQELIRALVAVVVLWKVGKWRPNFEFSVVALRKLASFGVSIMGINLLNVVNRRSDDLLVGYFLGSVALGYYNVAYQLLLLLTQLINAPINQVAFSAFSRLQGKPHQLRRALYKAARMVSLVSIPAFFFAATLAPQIVPLVFGDKWEQSILTMQILALIGPIHALGGLNANLMIALGKPSWRLGFNCLNAAANFPAFLLAVHWGIWAVAIAYVLRGYLIFPLPILAIKKLVKLNYVDYIKNVFPLAASGLLSVLLMLGIEAAVSEWVSGWVLLSACLISGCLLYLMCVMKTLPETLSQITRLVTQKIA